jgi:hypothetical protein
MIAHEAGPWPAVSDENEQRDESLACLCHNICHDDLICGKRINKKEIGR